MINSLIFIITISTFLNLFKYFSFYLHVPSYIFYFIVLLFVLIISLSKKKYIELSKVLFLWVIYYFIINTFYYIGVGAGGFIEYKRYVSVILLVIVFFGLSILYMLDTRTLSITRKSLLVAIIIEVGLLLYDFMNPGAFALPTENLFLAGRALGTYNNQNIAGGVLILGMILTIDIIPKKYRLFYIIYIFSGILVTFSRSNMMIFFLLVLFMAFQNKIGKRSIIIIYSTLFGILIWLGFGGLEWLGAIFNITITQDIIDRVNFFVDTKDVDLSNINERKQVLHAALDMFYTNPIFGNGFASTNAGIWEYRVGPHNGFVRTWAEFGIFGFIVIPFFVLAVIYETRLAQKQYRDLAILYSIYYILSSIFSHNILDQEVNLIGAIIIVILGYKNRIYNNIGHPKNPINLS